MKVKNKTAIYHNVVLNETYKISGVKDLREAWNLAEFVCYKNNWNISMFSYDVRVKLV